MASSCTSHRLEAKCSARPSRPRDSARRTNRARVSKDGLERSSRRTRVSRRDAVPVAALILCSHPAGNTVAAERSTDSESREPSNRIRLAKSQVVPHAPRNTTPAPPRSLRLAQQALLAPPERMVSILIRQQHAPRALSRRANGCRPASGIDARLMARICREPGKPREQHRAEDGS